MAGYEDEYGEWTSSSTRTATSRRDPVRTAARSPRGNEWVAGEQADSYRPHDGYDDGSGYDDGYDGSGYDDPDRDRRDGQARRRGARNPPEATAPWKSVLSAVLLPGLRLWRYNPVLGSAMFAFGVIVPVFVLGVLVTNASTNDLLRVMDNHPSYLSWVVITTVLALIVRFAAVLLTAQTHRRRVRRSFQLRGFACMVAALIPAWLVLDKVSTAQELSSTVFGQAKDKTRVEGNAAVAGRSSLPGGSTLPPVPTYDDVIHTILLVGSDESATDRFGARTDTMMLAFVHRPSGRTAIVSIPRNLVGITWPEGTAMAKMFPNGFHDGAQMANAINQTVASSATLRAAYDRGDRVPGIHALIEGLANSFGITIDDYAMVNSCSFVKIIDAVGPVYVDVPKRLPMPHGKFPCLKYELGEWMEPGRVKLDGTLAFGFARTRKADSDNGRMDRQRQLIEAIAEQMSFTKVLGSFNEIAAAIIGDVRTSLTMRETKDLATALQKAMKGSGIQGLGLHPPLIVNRDRNMALIHQTLYLIKKRLVENKPLPLNDQATRDALLAGQEPAPPAKPAAGGAATRPTVSQNEGGVPGASTTTPTTGG